MEEMSFIREAKRLLERKVAVDTAKKTYKGRLKSVEREFIVLTVKRHDQIHYDQIIIRIDEIIALYGL
jgi:hypothetical protein